MSFTLSSYGYIKNNKMTGLMQDRIRILELRELIDAERLARKNLKLEEKLLKLKIFNHKNQDIRVMRLSPTIVRKPKYQMMSLTPHPQRVKHVFR